MKKKARRASQPKSRRYPSWKPSPTGSGKSWYLTRYCCRCARLRHPHSPKIWGWRLKPNSTDAPYYERSVQVWDCRFVLGGYPLKASGGNKSPESVWTWTKNLPAFYTALACLKTTLVFTALHPLLKLQSVNLKPWPWLQSGFIPRLPGSGGLTGKPLNATSALLLILSGDEIL